MGCYDFEYAMRMLCQSIDFAETEHDFVPLRKWAVEVEESCYGMNEIVTRLNHPVDQNVLLTTLQLVAAGSLSPEEASQRIRLWLNHGQEQDRQVGLTKQYQYT
jgi:hypothetical protein